MLRSQGRGISVDKSPRSWISCFAYTDLYMYTYTSRPRCRIFGRAELTPSHVWIQSWSAHCVTQSNGRATLKFCALDVKPAYYSAYFRVLIFIKAWEQFTIRKSFTHSNAIQHERVHLKCRRTFDRSACFWAVHASIQHSSRHSSQHSTFILTNVLNVDLS